MAIPALVLLMPRLAQFAQITTGFLGWPWEFDYSEGVNLNAAVQLAAGHNIYRHSGPDGFISAPYTPIYYLLTAPITWLTGPSLIGGRAISLAATLAIAVLLVLIVGKLTSHWSAGLVAGALWLTLTPVIVWAALYTQHILALAFGFAGLAWVMLRSDRSGLASYIAPLFFALAFFTKQSALDMAAASALWLLTNDFRKGLRFCLTLAATIAVPFFAINLLLRGGLWEHAIANQQLPFNDRRFQKTLARIWSENWPLISLGAASLAGTIAALILYWRRRAPILASKWTLAVLYFVIATASLWLRIGREGVNANHNMDGLLPACLLFGLSLGWLLGAVQKERRFGGLYSAAGVSTLCLLLVFQIIAFVDPRASYKGAWPDPRTGAQMQALSQRVAATPGDVLAEDEYLLIRNHRPVVYDDDFTFMTLSRLGRWDQSTFVQSLWDRRFGLIVLLSGNGRLTGEASDALAASYTVESQDLEGSYKPVPVPSAPQYSLGCALEGNGDSISLLGYSLPPGVAWYGAARGSTLHVTLYWKPNAPVNNDYASHVQLINAQGERATSQDNPHTAAGKPTTAWQPGEMVLDSAGVPLPQTMPPGRYRIVGGMYRVVNGTLVDLASSCPENIPAGGAITLGQVDVK